MRSDIIHSFAAVLAVFAQVAAIFAVFGLPVAATADRSAEAMPTSSGAHERDAREITEVIVKVRRAI